MRILQIVTYISPGGAYGGPVRVAINQAKSLTEQGHEVLLAAAAGGFEGPLPTEFDDFPVQLFPARRALPKTGFAGLTSPGLLAWLAKAVHGADVVHIHLARDLVTLPSAVIALLSGKPLVVQTHGMIDRTDKALAKPLDRFFTRPVLTAARAVLYLTNQERRDLTEVAGHRLALHHLPNGIALPMDDGPEGAGDAAPEPEILYLARMQGRKRPTVFVAAASEVLQSGYQASFKLVGPDEGEATRVLQMIADSGLADHIHYEGPLDPRETMKRMKQCDVYVLPSVHEPYPMSVIEAMSAGKPVIITDTCGLSSHVSKAEAGLVVDDSMSALAESIRTLLVDKELRSKMGEAARRLVEEQFDLRSVGSELNNIYLALQDLEVKPRHNEELVR